jgi:cysteine sulfinate desulfinase/cysteine desulfurase-like protein
MQFGNPHSRTHMYGWESEDAVEKARGQVRQDAINMRLRWSHVTSFVEWLLVLPI